ncbi:calmodulin-binding protein 60 A-like isoform X2 [Lycium ferocissimum]|uniref:calmodulin-binding protein 60 A-like isoform X2 n=1 Tax=Lycium ferocissimum TaxID=112874 RepID=UPI0028154A04|nr:calmodulin-binding protein 60 A-like isoform X2 [Lycium ferocissimum]
MAQTLMFEDGNNAGELGKETSHTETTNSTPPFTRAIRDVASLCKLRRIVVAFLLALFPNFPVVAEFHFDLEIILTARNRNSQKKIHPSKRKRLLLNFSHKIAPVVFTGECIFPQGTKLELVDAVTGQQLRHGPLASAQVEIFLLNGDENRTIQELNNHIMMQKRGGKLGHRKNPYLRLQGGVVSVGEVRFKHTPKHMKKLKVVKLGARVVDQPEEIEVTQAVTGPFTVKDKRLMRSKKRYPPSLTDDVWRLDKIYRNGAFHRRLTENGIKTVEDFLIGLNNRQRLRQILGKSMSDDYWKKVTTHAKTCDIDGRTYLYYHTETEQKFAVVFDIAGHVIRLDSGCGLHQFNKLSESQKAYARKLVETAFANWESVLKFDNNTSIMDHLSSSILSPPPCPTLDDFQHSELQITSHAESDEMSLDIPAPAHTTTPNQITSMNADPEDFWENIMQFLNSDELQFEDFSYGEPGQANYFAAETSDAQFHELQHGETMDLSQNQFTDFMVSENVHSAIHIGGSTNVNQQRQMNNVSVVPEASMGKGKSKKSWAKISSILQWFLLKRFVKKVRISKKRK